MALAAAVNPREIADLLRENFQEVSPELAQALASYLALLCKWNARTNLTAVRAEREIVLRHFGESLACARFLPLGMETLLDFGSGAGFPGAVCALARPELRVCLAEAQGKKAAFLMELARELGTSFEVHAQRAETLPASRLFDAVTLRAVDRMEQACAAALGHVRSGGVLVLMTTEAEFTRLSVGFSRVTWREPVLLHGSDRRIIAMGTRAG